MVREVTNSAWTQTFGVGGYTVAATSGNTGGGDFGNFQNVTLSGKKWEDHNGNGIRDAGDQGLAGWTINVGNQTATTDVNGNWSITVGPGTFAIQEAATGQPWSSFTQTSGNGGYSVTTASGVNAGGNDFGNFQNVTLSGKKFTDHLGNDTGSGTDTSSDDTALAGWPVQLYTTSDGGVTLVPVGSPQNTGLNGSYQFGNLGPLPTGTSYVVREVTNSAGPRRSVLVATPSRRRVATQVVATSATSRTSPSAARSGKTITATVFAMRAIRAWQAGPSTSATRLPPPT